MGCTYKYKNKNYSEKEFEKLIEHLSKKTAFEKEILDDETKFFVQDISNTIIDNKKYSFIKLGNVFSVEAEGVGEIAKATLSKDGYLDNIRVDENYRRVGIASSLYDYVENIEDINLKPSPIKISKEARELWNKRQIIKDAIREFRTLVNEKQADTFIEVDGEIRQKSKTETEITLQQTAKQVESSKVRELLNLSLATLQNNTQATREVLNEIEDDLIESSIDVVGLKDQPIDENLIEYLNTLNTFIDEPSKENTKIFAEKSDEYFKRDLTPQKEAVVGEDGREYVKLNTELSEEEVYNQQGLIKVDGNTYVKTAKESLTDLYENLRTYTEKYPKDKSLEEYVQEQIANYSFKDAEVAEAVVLYKMYFGVNQISLSGLESQAKNAKSIEWFLRDIITDYDVRYKNRRDAVGLVEETTSEYIDSIKPKQEISEYIVESWRERIANGERPFVIIRLNNLIDGHHKLQAYKDLGINTIPVLYEQKLIDFYNRTITATNQTSNFIGNYQYLTEEFPSDFYSKFLAEKKINSKLFRDFYSNFEINEKGINIINTDPISMRNIRIYADENLMQYSILSKQMPNLSDDLNNDESISERDNVVNNPQTLEKFQGKIHKLNNNEVIVKNNTEQFIKIGDNIYEALETLGNLTHFAKIENEATQYHKVGIEKPTSNLKLSDYNYLNESIEEFTTIKKGENPEELDC